MNKVRVNYKIDEELKRDLEILKAQKGYRSMNDLFRYLVDTVSHNQVSENKQVLRP